MANPLIQWAQLLKQSSSPDFQGEELTCWVTSGWTLLSYHLSILSCCVKRSNCGHPKLFFMPVIYETHYQASSDVRINTNGKGYRWDDNQPSGNMAFIVSGTVTTLITQVYQAFLCLNSLYGRSFNPPNLFWLCVRCPHWFMCLNIWSPDGGAVLGGCGAFRRWVATKQKGYRSWEGFRIAGSWPASWLLNCEHIALDTHNRQQ